ncbi:orotate phosphoribosyltransferase [Candidatus Pacearchaeota archaeon]|nr:orotate phosphoribosyltransferase [Candidatus Pacearchaeota archaeon]
MGGLIEKLNQLDVLERQKVILKSKKISDFYIDIKKAYGFPEILNEITDRLYALIPKEANCIAASDYGGLPLATAISSKYGLNLTLIRNKKKNHGLNKLIDGYIPNPKDKIAIVDDVMTTGTSLKKIIKIIKPTKAKILGCYVVVNRGKADLKYPLHWLFEAKDFFEK